MSEGTTLAVRVQGDCCRVKAFVNSRQLSPAHAVISLIVYLCGRLCVGAIEKRIAGRKQSKDSKTALKRKQCTIAYKCPKNALRSSAR